MKKQLFIPFILISLFFSCKDNPVEPMPIADFTFQQTNNGVVNFKDFSANAKSVYWDFGDGSGLTSSPKSTVTHQYKKNLEYIVKIIVKNASNDESRASSRVRIENILGTAYFFKTYNVGDVIEVKLDGNIDYIFGGYGYYPDLKAPACGDSPHCIRFSGLGEGRHYFQTREMSGKKRTSSGYIDVIGGQCSGVALGI
jgi:hypothetical protein